MPLREELKKSYIKVYCLKKDILVDGSEDKQNLLLIKDLKPERIIIAVCPDDDIYINKNGVQALRDIYESYQAGFPIIYFGENVLFRSNSFTAESFATSTGAINADVIICRSSFNQASFNSNIINGVCILFHPKINGKQCFWKNTTKEGLFVVGNDFEKSDRYGNYPISQQENVYYLSGQGLMDERRKVKLSTALYAKFSNPDFVELVDVLNIAFLKPEERGMQPSKFFLNKKKIAPLTLESKARCVTFFDPAKALDYNEYDRENLLEIRTIIAVCLPDREFKFSDITENLMAMYEISTTKKPIIYFGMNVYFNQNSFTKSTFKTKKDTIDADVIFCGSHMVNQSIKGNQINGLCILFNPQVNTSVCFTGNEITGGLFVVGNDDKNEAMDRCAILHKENVCYLSGRGLMRIYPQTINPVNFSFTLRFAIRNSNRTTSRLM